MLFYLNDDMNLGESSFESRGQIGIVAQDILQSSNYIPHDPIFIEGDDNFTVANGVTGGNGTSSDPYVIQSWDISLPNTQADPGILIRNTTAHFAVRSCLLHPSNNTKFLFVAGIYLPNCVNGILINNQIVNNYPCISLENSHGISP